MTEPGDTEVFKCPHCGNETVNVLISFTAVDEMLELVDSRTHEIDNFLVESYFFITKCKTCNQVSVFTSADFDEMPYNLSSSFQIWPKNKVLGDGVPKSIEDRYDEANKVKKVSPLAFSILIRRCLEQLCKDKGATGKNLKEKIEDLGKKKIIPETLADMADIIRETGNTGAHGDKFKLNKFDMDVLDDFFIAVIEYVYVAPQRLVKIKDRLKKALQ